MSFKKSLKILDHSITERNYVLSRYFNEVAKIELIDQDKEVELTRRIKNGDKKAEEELIIANLRFVISCAKNYQNKGLSLEDLISEGNLGLIRAARQFDETRGFKFISYAVVWVRNYILTALADSGRLVRLPSNKIAQKSKIHKFISENLDENELLLIEKVCEKFNIDIKTYQRIVKSDSNYSLDDKIQENDYNSQTYGDCLKSENDFFDNFFDNNSNKKKIQYGLKYLTDREKKVIIDYFGLNGVPEKTCEKIGLELSLTKERVRQLKDNALKKLKRKIKQQFKSEIL